MSDELTPEATASAKRGDPASPPSATADSGAADGVAPSAPNGENGDGAARRRRRRGSRGGRNRRKPATSASRAADGATTDTTSDADASSDDDAPAEPSTAPGGAKPKIGDRRPAPATPTETPSSSSSSSSSASSSSSSSSSSRRRRRGGRGRSSGGSTPAVAAVAAVAEDAVRADLGVGDAVDLDDLDDEQRARRRGRTRKGRPAGRYQLLVHQRTNGHTHMALLEGRVLVEHSVSTPTDADTSIDGNIYLGRVQNVLPGMEAAFIDIGTPKNGVLYRGDVSFDADEVEEKQPRIERLLKAGQSVVVQVTKNPIGAKGARLTQEVSLAGRFVVMVPGQPETYGISKRLPDDERRRLRRVLEGVRPPDAGLIVRTAAEGATAEELERDVRRLREQWEQISALASRSKPARALYEEPPLALRIIREEFTKEYRGVVLDDRSLYEDVRAYIEAVTPELSERVEYYDPEEEGLPIFERYHVNEQLLKALDRKVWLPSGGSLVIERTEALTVIDVNTGKNVGSSSLEETVYRNNLEAGDEIARQLRLRDIGGIIVIDFIDMEVRANRESVINAFRSALARDKTRTQAFEITELGLVEMTRKRISEGLVESMSETCPTCQGHGYLLEETLLEELQ
jgi:ribonuclease E